MMINRFVLPAIFATAVFAMTLSGDCLATSVQVTEQEVESDTPNVRRAILAESDTYLDLKSGSLFRLHWDAVTNTYVRDDGQALDIYTSTTGLDTFWGPTAVLVNRSLSRDAAGTIRVDQINMERKVKENKNETKVKTEDYKIKENEKGIKVKGDDSKLKSNENEFKWKDGDRKIKSNDNELKVKDGDDKIKSNGNELKMKEGDAKIKENANERKYKDGDVKIKENANERKYKDDDTKVKRNSKETKVKTKNSKTWINNKTGEVKTKSR